MRPRLLFYVMHLQGIGHVVRASRIVARLADDGFDVTLVLGGMPLDGLQVADARINVVQLPPLRMAADSYRVLLTAEGRPIDEAYKAARLALLMDALTQSQPDAVMIEAYPFDRPQMHFELVPFLDEVIHRQPRPVVISSIRDILQRKDKPERDDRALELLDTYFDHVLVHGDPQLATLDKTFRHARAIAAKVQYTGIVAPPPFQPIEAPAYDVIVTAGGGTTGKCILEAAIAAKPMTGFCDDRWVVTLGHNIPEETARAVRAAGAAAGVDVLDFLADIGRHLLSAKLSISQCGYNTAVDLLRTGCPAVLCPYSGGRQNEQLQRAELMAEQGLAVLLREDELDPAALARAVDRALTLPPRRTVLNLEGAANTARLLRGLIDERRAAARDGAGTGRRPA